MLNHAFNIIIPYIKNITDIILVAFVIYYLYLLIARTKVIATVFGIIILSASAFTSHWFELETMTWLFEIISPYLVFTFIIVFQPEIRRAFSEILNNNLINSFFKKTTPIPVDEIIQTCTHLVQNQQGALIIITNQIDLKKLITSGILINAILSKELLLAIFTKNSPLHDGAVIIEGANILSVATYLPLSQSKSQLKKTHGARHRAGLGIAEETDSFAVIISEEKKEINVAYLGELKEKIDLITLKAFLTSFNNGTLTKTWVKTYS